MTIDLKIPDSMKISNPEEVQAFLQYTLNRLLVGELRYGPPHRKKRYMRSLAMELRAYRKTGNFEQLLNIANYAYLESAAPENKNFFFDPEAASATREALGGNIV